VGPAVQFLCAAYNSTKAETDGLKLRMFIRTEWFQERWGDVVRISPFQDNARQFNTTAGGYRINTGVPESMGKGGLIRTIDDPSKADEVESDTARETVNRNYDEIWSTRGNDPVHGAEVIVMQRLGKNDLSGHLLATKKGWCHLMLPMFYDPTAHCETAIGWQDPRGLDDDTGEFLHGLRNKKGGGIEVIPGSPLESRVNLPLWEDRFTYEWCREKEAEIGPYAWAAQFQQIPAPRGGGIILEESWRLWEKATWPAVDLVLVSLDGAFTDRTANDPSAITVWGRFTLPDVRQPQFMLMWAWQGHLLFNDLVELAARTCNGDWRGRLDGRMEDGSTNPRADILLIENKACGPSVAQEIIRLNGKRKWRTFLINPQGDKTGRLTSVQPLFSGLRRPDGTMAPGQVWAPETVWADMVIDQVSQFPKAGHDDLVDTVSQGLRWLRDAGAVQTEEEAEDEWRQQNTYQRPRRALYPSARHARA
jgi:hypothetical protein